MKKIVSKGKAVWDWAEPVRKFLDEFRRADIQTLAASLSYTTVLSIVPLIAVSFSVFKTVGGFDKLFEHVRPLLIQYLSAGISGDLLNQVEAALGRIHSGTVGLVGASVLLFTAMKLILDIEAAVLKIWRIRKSGFQYLKVFVYLLSLFAIPISIAVLVGMALYVDPRILQLAPKSLITTSGAIIILFLIYKFVPSCPVRTRAALSAALAVAASVFLIQLFYSSIVGQFFNYNKIYGSLASIPILLLWIWLHWTVVLSGVYLTTVFQKRLAN